MYCEVEIHMNGTFTFIDKWSFQNVEFYTDANLLTSNAIAKNDITLTILKFNFWINTKIITIYHSF